MCYGRFVIAVSSLCWTAQGLAKPCSQAYLALVHPAPSERLQTCRVAIKVRRADGVVPLSWRRWPVYGDVLLPEKRDADGDGRANLLDAQPWRHDASVDDAGALPVHLRFEGRRGELQERLWQEARIAAISRGGQLSVRMLRTFYEAWTAVFSVLRRPLPKLEVVIAVDGLDIKGNASP